MSDDVKKQKERIQRRKDLFDSDKYQMDKEGKSRLKASYRSKKLKEVPGPEREKVQKELDKMESEYRKREWKRKLEKMTKETK